MAVLNIKTNFNSNFTGELITDRAQVAIGSGEGRLAPYDMLLAALSSCLYATFLGVVEKKRLTFDRCEITVKGEKRTEIPTTLQWCQVEMRLFGAVESKEKHYIEAAKLAGEYCSIYQTLSNVADMSTEVIFEAPRA